MNKRAVGPRKPPASRVPWIVLGVVIVVGVAAVVAVASSNSGGSGGSSGGTSSPATAAALVQKLESLPASVSTKVGAGSVALPKSISAPVLTKDGKPLIVYMGAEYCPYCAAQRWAMVLALSRFGDFTNLGTTHSASEDVFPDTQTFSFHGSTYTSPVLAFEGVEMSSNVRSGAGYALLDTPTAAQRQLMTTYNAPPYVPAGSTGSIPFIDIGGKYLMSGASFSPSLLKGKSATDIANALRDPSNEITKGIVATANVMTAAICATTNGAPADVCGAPEIKAITARLK